MHQGNTSYHCSYPVNSFESPALSPPTSLRNVRDFSPYHDTTFVHSTPCRDHDWSGFVSPVCRSIGTKPKHLSQGKAASASYSVPTSMHLMFVSCHLNADEPRKTMNLRYATLVQLTISVVIQYQPQAKHFVATWRRRAQTKIHSDTKSLAPYNDIVRRCRSADFKLWSAEVNGR